MEYERRENREERVNEKAKREETVYHYNPMAALEWPIGRIYSTILAYIAHTCLSSFT